MKHAQLLLLAAALLSAGLLTACGEDSSSTQTSDTAEVTTTGTTAETTTGTTADTTATTETATDTGTSEGTAETTTDTTASEAEQTDAPPADQPADQNADPQPGTQTTEKLIWDELKIGVDPAAYLAANTNYTKSEADSCIGDGIDIIYTYSDRVLYVYSENGKNKLSELEINAPGIKTRKGIEVGASADAVKSAYGASDDDSFCSYTTEDGTLEFLLDGGKVTLITLH